MSIVRPNSLSLLIIVPFGYLDEKEEKLPVWGIPLSLPLLKSRSPETLSIPCSHRNTSIIATTVITSATYSKPNVH